MTFGTALRVSRFLSSEKLVQSFQRVLFFASFDSRSLKCAAQKLDRFVVEFAVNGIGMPIFAAMCKAEYRRVFPTSRGAIGDFTDQSQSAQGLGADAGMLRSSSKSLALRS